MKRESVKPPPPGPLLLKDCLVEDMSSCSSNGFRSYPRRECCTTVRFLLEADLRDLQPRRKPVADQPLVTGRTAANKAPKTSVVSALQRASKTVIKAVKILQLATSAAAVKSEKQSKQKKATLPENFSRKVLKRNSNKKSIDRNETERWKVYNQLMEKISKPSDSNCSTSETNSKSNSWYDSDFTISGDSLQSSGCISDVNSTMAQNDAVAAKTSPAEKVFSNESVGVTNVYPPDKQKHVWSISTCNIENEHSSPVSILEYPFEDEDEVSSPFQDKLNLQPETMKKLMKKIKRFESLKEIKPPLNLSKRIEPTPDIFTAGSEEQSRVQLEASILLQQLKSAGTPSCSLKLNATEERLLLDFFGERMVEDGFQESEIMKEAEDWITGEWYRFWHEWGVEKNRKGYIEDMERDWKWKRIMDVENGELAMELETHVLTCLVNELIVDIASLNKG